MKKASVLFLILFVRAISINAQKCDSIIVLRINDHNISAEEFVWWFKQYRSDCYSYFLMKYGNYDSADFWTHSFDGEQPVNWLIKATFRHLKTNYSTLEVFQKFGVLMNFDFSDFRSRLAKRNNPQNNKAEMNQYLYGNISQNDFVFYSYLFSQAEIETKRRILIKYPPAEPQLKQLYDSLKYSEFKRHPDIQVAIKWYHQNRGIQKGDTVMFKGEYRKEDEIKWGNIFQKIITLKKGDSTALFQDDDKQLCSVRCLLVKDRGFLNYNEVKNNLRSIYADILFDVLFAKMQKNELTKINLKGMNQISGYLN